MKRGDVVRVDLPRPRGSPGREQLGLRPAVIVQDEESQARQLATVLIVPLTSNLTASRFAGAVTLSPSHQNGLSVESVALTHQVRAVDRQRIQEALGEVSAADLSSIERELRALLKL